MYEALKSFSGAVSMSVGDIRDISDVNIAKDLLRAGYIREIKPATKGKAEQPKAEKAEAKLEPKAEKKPVKGKAKKG